MDRNNNIVERRILKIQPFIECPVIRRLNRFVVEVEISGRSRRAHINNTGRLHEFMFEGKRAYCFPSSHPGKTDCRLFAFEDSGFGALVDTQLQMKAFETALRTGLVPWLKGCILHKRNARLKGSLIDYHLVCSGKTVLCEIKSAVLREGGFAMYPDCPSTRGQRHLRELTDWVRGGGRAAILFMAALAHAAAFKPNKDADPLIYRHLKTALKAGVQIRAMGLYFNPADGWVYLYNPDLRVEI